MSNLNAKEYKRHEDIKNLCDDGSEFWSARELALCLEYTVWPNFTNVIEGAILAC
ncbi:MAG: hypothetical protein LBF68_06225 [Christensenellaceae bacterium]|jgi:DNA-damage-inducible protein D|nr:hypothetical protein [Christensenellaceae bacterium]